MTLKPPPNAATTPVRILVIDDEPDMVDLVVDELGFQGFDASGMSAPGDAVAEAQRIQPDVIVSDLNMPGINGVELCRALTEALPNVPVVMMTAFGSIGAAVEAMRAGAYDFLTKPLDMSALTLAVERANAHRALTLEVLLLRSAVQGRTFHDFIGDSAPMQNLYNLIARIGPSESSVLLRGETGTGKELAARALHQESSRRDGPFVSINLSAVPEALLESQFFGHEKGAFTDARTKQRGLLLAAHKGTLFLDEIGDMPLSLQPKLLRALQERTVRPLGSTQEVPFDTRIVAATHQDLGRAVAAGTFREDLYYRLNVIEIDLPPLRDREGDVVTLAHAFLKKFAARGHHGPPLLSPAALEQLVVYRWPGNVRELENAMERVVALSGDGRVELAALPKAVSQAAVPQRTSPVPSSRGVELLPLSDIEERHILAVIRAVDGNKQKAAKILGLDRRTLYRRLEKYDDGDLGAATADS